MRPKKGMSRSFLPPPALPIKRHKKGRITDHQSHGERASVFVRRPASIRSAPPTGNSPWPGRSRPNRANTSAPVIPGLSRARTKTPSGAEMRTFSPRAAARRKRAKWRANSRAFVSMSDKCRSSDRKSTDGCLHFLAIVDEIAAVLGVPVHMLTRDSGEQMSNSCRRESILADPKVICQGTCRAKSDRLPATGPALVAIRPFSNTRTPNDSCGTAFRRLTNEVCPSA